MTVLLLVVGCGTQSNEYQVAEVLNQQTPISEKQEVVAPSSSDIQTENQEVVSVVKKFGEVLKNVSLLAPEDVLNKSLLENYGKLLSPFLLEFWIKNPQEALGRMVSSP